MKKILIVALSGIGMSCFADGSFSVFPTQVVFEQPGKIKELTLINQSNNVLNTQSTFVSYTQLESQNKLIESNAPITGSPAIMVTPIVIQNVAPNTTQAIRLLAIKQNPESEIVYRYVIKSLSPQSIDSSGTQFEISYGVPVFVLPQKINESYNFIYRQQGKNAYVQVQNTGNVHLLMKNVYIQNGNQKVAIGSVGRLLAGQSTNLNIPPAVYSSLTNKNQIQLNVAKAGLVKFEQESQIQLTLTKQ